MHTFLEMEFRSRVEACALNVHVTSLSPRLFDRDLILMNVSPFFHYKTLTADSYNHFRNQIFPFAKGKECRSIVRDESSVYFNVTVKHVWHLVARVYKPIVPCMITIELSDIWLISEAIYHLIFTQDPLNWSLESPPQHRDDFVMPTFLYRVKKQPKMLTLVKICICAT